MDLHQLSSFVAVAETGKVSLAASRCHLTQGAISQQLKLLEDELATPLFIRAHKEMILTAVGEVFLSHARTILHDVQQGRDAVAAAQGHLRGELRIGAGSFIEPFLGPVIAEFITRYPDVRVRVQYDYAHVLNRQLRNHDIDIAFSINKAYTSESITSIPSFRFSLQAIMPCDHPLSHRRHLSCSDIAQYRVMLPDIGVREMDSLQQYASEDINILQDASIGDTNNINALLNSVKHLGIITMLPPEYVIQREGFVAKPVNSFSTKLVCYRHTMRHTSSNAVVKAFVAMLNSSSLLSHISSPE